MPLRLTAALTIVALASVADARAHVPSTSIGRAVEAFGSVSVSYEPGAAVSDVEAGGFPQVVDSDPKVAFMPAEAVTELAGGPDAIAEEIAREAVLQGTLVVLVGTSVGLWSTEIRDERLAELAREARMANAGGSPAVMVEQLIRAVQAESSDDTPWGWIAAAIAAVGIGSLVVLAGLSRRRSRPAG